MNSKTMCSRLMSLGIPKAASHQLVVQIGHWVKHSGEEWTVERLKEVKLIYLHQLAGSTYTPKHWIKLRGGIPTGALRPLFRSKKNLSKVLTALMAYSAYVSSKVTAKQREKFLSSMQSEDETGLWSTIRRVKPVSSKPPSRPPTIVEYCTSRVKRGPSEKGTAPEMDRVQMFLHGAMSDAVRMVVARHEDIFSRVIPIDMFFNVEPHPRREIRRHTLGRISAIQEPGFKLRAVANPSRVLQSALEPLKEALKPILRSFSTDFTFDQGSAVPIVQNWLQQGREVYSVDLSDATNLFPWHLQRELLKDSFTDPEMRQLISIMDDCATGPWENSLGGEPVCRFTRGQPLGLGPSFYTFAFAHNTLLQGICDAKGIEPRFCVLGDDVVIADRNLHRIYRATLNNLGCKVSLSKTFRSKEFAEFAGYSITKDRVGKGFKWRVVSNHSFYDAVANLGKCALPMLSKKQRRVAQFLGPIPKSLGGLGWSDGRTLDQFLASPIAEPSIMAMLDRSSKKTAVVYRNLDADLQKFTSEVSRYQTASFAEELMDGRSWRQLRVPDFIDIDPHLLQAGPSFKVYDLTKAQLSGEEPPPSIPGYYPVIEREGDPRPNAFSLFFGITEQLKSILQATNELGVPPGKEVYFGLLPAYASNTDSTGLVELFQQVAEESRTIDRTHSHLIDEPLEKSSGKSVPHLEAPSVDKTEKAPPSKEVKEPKVGGHKGMSI